MDKIAVINIFLASSIVELKEEREKIRELITNLNGRLEKRNIMFRLFDCEQGDYVYEGNSQAILNERIKRCEYVIFIVGKKLGEKTNEEFNCALEKYKIDNKTKITVYLKNVPGDKSVTDFKDYMRNELAFYYGTYDNIDEIKAHITGLLNTINDNIVVHKEDGIYIDGEKFSNYVDDIDESGFGFTKEYIEANENYKNHNYGTAKDILEKDYSNRHQKGIKDIKIIGNSNRNKGMALIKENELLIELANKKKIDDKSVKEKYEENIKIEQYAGLEPDNEYLYGNYLYEITDYYGAFKHLFAYFSYQKYMNSIGEDNIIKLTKAYLRLGTIYSHAFQFEDSYYCYKKAVELHEDILKEKGEVCLFERADAYNKLGNACDDIKEYEFGEKNHQIAIEIYKKNLDSIIAKHELGYSLNKQGNIFRHKAIDEQDKNKKKEYFEKALYYYGKNKSYLEETIDDLHTKQSLGINEKSFGLTYYAMGDYNEALVHFNKSLDYLIINSEKKIDYMIFQYAKVLYHKADTLRKVNGNVFDIYAVLSDNQNKLKELYDKKVNLREVLYELYRSYLLSFEIKNKKEFKELFDKYNNELEELKKKKQPSIL